MSTVINDENNVQDTNKYEALKQAIKSNTNNYLFVYIRDNILSDIKNLITYMSDENYNYTKSMFQAISDLVK